MEQRHSSSNLLYKIMPPTLLAFITSLVYYPSLNYEFQFDDIANITKHYEIRHDHLEKLFFSGTRWISYWINSLYYKFIKFEPFYYRVGNLLIHIANGLLVFFILQLVLNNLPKKSFFTRNAFGISFLTSLLYSLHPVQTQTISYVIQGQLEGLAAFFSLAMACSFLLFGYSKKLWAKIAFVLFYFSLAFFCTGTKEIAIVTPILILVLDWFFVARGSINALAKRWWFHLLSFGIVLGMYVYLLKPKFFLEILGMKKEASNNLGNIITVKYDEKITPYAFFISQFKVILHYLWIFIWPFGISVEYDWVLSRGFFAPDCFIPFLILSTIAFLVFKILKRNPTNLIAFGVIWFAITIAPRSSIVASPELMVDYKTYLASFGWLFIIACTLIKLYDLAKYYSIKFKQRAERFHLGSIAVGCLALLLGTGTIQRNTVWRSGVEFWGNIVDNAPGKARAYNNYGVEISQKLGRFADSIPYFEHAIAMDKNYRDPYNNLAVAYAATHQLDRAIETLHMSLRINPYYPEAYNNIASFMIEKKDFEQAKRALAVALQLRPYYGKAHFNFGRIYMELGEKEKALEYFKKACTEADLDNEAGFMGYAKCALELKEYDQAIFACQKTLECNPNNDDVAFSLANAYFMKEKFSQAIQIYQALIQKAPHDPKLWYNLAETHFSAGNTTQALAAFERLKKSPMVNPNLYIRIAACHEKLGNYTQAKHSLDELLRMNLPEDARQTVAQARTKLIQQYGLF